MIHKAKKSLGQNFLKSEMALRKIVEAGDITKDDIILEIGPGKGALTEKLLEKAGKVVAIEKDSDLFVMLQEKFAEEITEGKLILIEDDILEFSFAQEKFSQAWTQPDHSKTFPVRNYKVIANIPYNITGAILKQFLGGTSQPESMVLMVQHEVAQRIIAHDKKESLLSISVKAYGEPKMVMKVPRRYFSPSPKVDSAVISIKNISRKLFEESNISEENFWKIVHAGFAHKRKKLSGNLKTANLSLKGMTGEVGDKRAEDLSLKDWIALLKI